MRGTPTIQIGLAVCFFGLFLGRAGAEEPPGAGPNLVANPSFEEGEAQPAAWTFSSGNPYFGELAVDGAARTGQRCVRLDSRSTHYGHYLVQEVTLPQPGRHRVAAWVRLDGGAVVLRAAGSAEGSGAGFAGSEELRGYRGHPLVPDFVPLAHTQGVRDTDWHGLQFAVDVPPGVRRGRVEIGFYFTPGRLWIDDVFFGPIGDGELAPLPSEPSSADFESLRGDWTKEDTAARTARIGLPGARSRTRADGPEEWTFPDHPYLPESEPRTQGVRGPNPGVTPDRPRTSSARGSFQIPGLTIRDGKKKREPLPCGDPVVTGGRGRWRVSRPFLDGSGEVTEEVASRETYTSWKATVRNDSHEEKWLELELALPTGLGMDAAFWDGVEEAPVARGWRERRGVIFAFPVACVYDHQQGFALGVEPYRDLGYLAGGIRERQGGVELYYAARVVVGPHSSDTVDFIAFRFPPRWAWREAVQVYYDAFPDFTRPTPGIDPRLTGIDGYVYASMDTRHLQMEECRRFHIGWEWVYGPFQTPGDWYPDEAHWDPRKGYGGTKDLHHNEVPGTLEDYRQATRDRFHRGCHACSMLFYIVPQFCEKKFLEEEYPDSWWLQADGSHWSNPKGYVKTDDDTALAWPLHTSYGRATLEDLRRIAADFQPGGFAFDCAHGFASYHGPAQTGVGWLAGGLVGSLQTSQPPSANQQTSKPANQQTKDWPGRAWNEEGQTFLLESTALGALIDEIHQMRANKLRLGVCANGPYTYMMGRRTDVSLFEPCAFRWQHYFSRQWPVRLLSGRKLINWHTGHGELLDLIRWQELEPAALRRDLRGALDFTLLWSLWLGAAPSAVDVRGFPKVGQWMPMLLELARAGWQPVPAVEADGNLLASRYGEGVGGFVALSNPTSRRIRGQARLQAGYLGPGAYLLSRYDGSPIPCESNENQTRFAYNLAPREALVGRTLLEVRGSGTFTGTVQYDPDPLQAAELVADFTADKPSYTALLVQLPSGARVTEVVFNSIPYAPRVSRTGRLRGAALPAHADRAQSALSRAAGPQFQREALHSRRSLHSSGPAAPSADWTFHNGILRLGVSLRARNRLVVRYEPRILFASPLEEILQHPLIENGRASCAIVVAEKAPERDRISAQRLAAYVEYYLRRQAKPDVFCWSLTGEAEGLCPPILESGFVVGNGRRAVPMTSGVVGDGGGTTVPDYKRNGTTVPDYKRDGTTVPDYKLILIGGPACFGLEKAVSVPAGGGIVRFVDWRGHRALLVTGADDRRTEEAVLRLLRVFDERYPFFGALSEGGFYQRAGLSGGVLEDKG